MSIITPPWKIRFFEKLRKAESSLSINLTLSAAFGIDILGTFYNAINNRLGDVSCKDRSCIVIHETLGPKLCTFYTNDLSRWDFHPLDCSLVAAPTSLNSCDANCFSL